MLSTIAEASAENHKSAIDAVAMRPSAAEAIASANVVVANLAARAGHPIRFAEFFRYGSVVVVESLVISTIYVWLRYLN